jgi:hypothetical protein
VAGKRRVKIVSGWLEEAAQALADRHRSLRTWEPRSKRKAMMTMNHSNPRTSFEELHITAKARVVQGSRKKPMKGTSQLSKARPSRSLNSQIANSASRGESSAMRRTRQPMG